MTARTDDSLLRIVIVVVAVLLLFPLLMMSTFPMMGMMGGMWGTGTTMSPVWGLGMILLFLVVLVGIGYFLYRSLTQGALSTNDRALEELRIAYARGELSQEEFEGRRESLERKR